MVGSMPRFKFNKRKKKAESADTTMTTGEYNEEPTSPKVLDKGIATPGKGRMSALGSGVNSAVVSVKQTGGEGVTTAKSPWRRHKLFNSPFPRYRHAAASISSEKSEIFLMGGLKEGSVFGDTWKIIPRESSDGELSSFVAENIEIINLNNPPARVGHSSVLCGNAFIIFGGDTVDTDFNGFPDNNFYLFNINNNKYTIPSHILNKPDGRYGHSIGALSLNSTSSRLYLFGGQLESEVFNDLYCFELNSFKSPKARWELVEPLNDFKPPPVANHSMSVYKNKIFIFGGVYNNERVSNDLWCFDALSNKWSQIATTGAVPLPTNEHSSCIINEKLYIYGGNDFSGAIYGSMYVLDLQTLVWSQLTDVGSINGPGARCGHTMTYLPRYNVMVIMGGDKNDYVVEDPTDFEAYDEYTGQDIGTMIYELDVELLDNFLREMPAQSSDNGALWADAGAGAAAGAAGGAAGAGFAGNLDPGADSSRGRPLVAKSHGTDKRGRSYSGGFEDFRTPNGSISPDRFRDNDYGATDVSTSKADAGDKFVDVDLPSGVYSEPHMSTEDLTMDKDVLPSDGNNVADDTYNNGHYDKDSTPIAESNDTNVDYGVTGSTAGSAGGVGAASAIGAAGGVGTAGIIGAASSEKEPSSRRFRSGSYSSFARQQATEEKHNNYVEELKNKIAELQASANADKEVSTQKVNGLQREILQIKESHYGELSDVQKQVDDRDGLIAELKKSINPAALDVENSSPDASSTRSITELSKYKIERLELKNKLVYLEQENKKLNTTFAEFEPFMNNQIGELSNFQKVIKVQEDKIAKLTSQVKDQEILHQEISDWKTKYENLNIQYDNYKAIHSDDDYGASDQANDVPDASGGLDRSIPHDLHKKSKKELASHLEALVGIWSTKNKDISQQKNLDPAENRDVVSQLQQQVDDLLRVSKQTETTSTEEINKLKDELTDKLYELRTLETNYRDALQSVNNTSRALKMNEDDLKNQRLLLEKLQRENRELKLYRRASKRGSKPVSPIIHEESPDFGEFENEHNDTNDDEVAIAHAHYNMKVKDLEADLYIIRQERDQLKDSVTSLKKELYLMKSD